MASSTRFGPRWQPVRRALIPLLAGCLPLHGGCLSVPLNRTKGPEIVLSRTPTSVRTEGPLSLELEEAAADAPGPLSGRVLRLASCQEVERQDIERTDRLKADFGPPLVYVVVGLALTAGGAALLATSPGRPDMPRGDDYLSSRHKFIAWGTLFTLPGVALTGGGVLGFIQGRPRKETTRYTKDIPLSEATACLPTPTPDATLYLSAPELELERSPVATTDAQGAFRLTLLGHREGLRPSDQAGEIYRDRLDQYGLHYLNYPGVRVEITLEASLEPPSITKSDADLGDGEREENTDDAQSVDADAPSQASEDDPATSTPEAEGDAGTQAGDDEASPTVSSDPTARTTIALGDWFTKPARRIDATCRAGSTVKRCDEALATLAAENRATPDALVAIELWARELKGSRLGTYTGAFKNGLRHGRGTAVYSTGQRYEGQWKAGFFHGRGVFSDEEGFRYAGQFEGGRFHGQGRLQSPEGHPYGQLDYRGAFKDGQRHGQGTGLYPGYRYEGEWLDNKPHGQGAKIMDSGLIVEATYQQGEFVRTKPVVFRWPNGVIWEGRWRGGEPKGTMRFENRPRRSPSQLYVLAGRLLDEGEQAQAKAILRHIADKHPSTDAARRAVDRLASLREQAELDRRVAAQIEALEEAEAERARDAARDRRERERDRQLEEHRAAKRRRAAEQQCIAGCEGLSRDGLISSEYSRCKMRCLSR